MEKVYDLWLAERLIKFRGEVRSVCENYGNSYEVFSNSFEDTKYGLDISENCAKALSDKSLENAKRTLALCTKLNIATVSYNSEFYPEFLREIENPPFLLFVRGNLNLLKNRFCVSTVGTRRMSSYGKYYGFKISYELASAGAVIVSGMAKGIDSVTHAGALAAGGKTIAVLGCGVDVVYPKEHQTLYKRIIEGGGAVISEFLPGTSPYPANFPIRNRIICGISYSTVVVEAPKHSGALITAGEAIKEGRTVFALPGNINATTSYGTNELIQGGARLIKDASDILHEYRHLNHINVDFNAFRRAHPQKETCDRALLDLKVSANLYDQPSTAAKFIPEEIFDSSRSAASGNSESKSEIDKENAKKDFPFSVFQSAGAESIKKKVLKSTSDEKEKDNEDLPKSIPAKESAFEEKLPERAENTGSSAAPKLSSEVKFAKKAQDVYGRMLAGCEDFGIDLTEDVKKVCKMLSECERVTVDALCEQGCAAREALQVLSVLVQTGMAEEDAGGVYILLK